jgi:hypothetical protein
MSIFRRLVDRLHKKEDEPSVEPKPAPNGQIEQAPAQIPSGETPLEREMLEVPDPWGIGEIGPFVLERNPDIHAILSSPHPVSPKPLAIWNKYYEHPAEQTREVLAMAYMRHPSAEVRKATVRFVGAQPRTKLSVGLILAQRLTVDPDEDLCRVAAEAIRKRGQEELLETMKYLAANDEDPGDDGKGAIVSRQQVKAALQTLWTASAARPKDFKDALLSAWCAQDLHLVKYGHTLLDLWSNRKTFSDDRSRTVARNVGVELYSLGGIDAMKMIFRPVSLLVGSEAASELNHAWSGVGGWTA